MAHTRAPDPRDPADPVVVAEGVPPEGVPVGLDPAFVSVWRLKLALIFGGIVSALVLGLLPVILFSFLAYLVAILLSGGLVLVLFLVCIYLLGDYYRSFRYELHPREIRVRARLVTERVVRIPIVRIQNTTVVQGVFQKPRGIYTLKIETAGGTMSASTNQKFSEGYINGIRNAPALEQYLKTRIREGSGLGTERAGAPRPHRRPAAPVGGPDLDQPAHLALLDAIVAGMDELHGHLARWVHERREDPDSPPGGAS